MRAIEESISVSEAGRNLEEIVKRVAENNDSVILDVEGEPKAVVVPMELYQRLKRREIGDMFQVMAERADMDPDEADALAAEAVSWARSNKEA
ncbi:MAG TPA: type II toxin-antitoxin system Phd/YefM family antitoxin [Chloroflexia bacterium]|nr:type II toxin-antitoxin system Phd/YefM family antitoxin [Chloroflexia bacterium]